MTCNYDADLYNDKKGDHKMRKKFEFELILRFEAEKNIVTECLTRDLDARGL